MTIPEPLQHLCALYTDDPSHIEPLMNELQNLQFTTDQLIHHIGDPNAPYRTSYLCTSIDQAQTLLSTRSAEQWQHTPPRSPKIAFLFTGQGAQYINMCQHLYQHQPRFKQHLDQAASVVDACLEQSILSIIFNDSDAPQAHYINQTAYTQPALFVIEYALAHLWMDHGIYPDVVIGHSVGEFAAATIAGLLSLEAGAALITERARLMQALPENGAMAALMSDALTLEPYLASYIEAGAFDIAALNGPKQTVISGDTLAIEQCLETLKKEGIRGRKLTVSHAFHSPHMDPMLDTFEAFAEQYPAHGIMQCTLISNLTGQVMDTAPDASYWRRHVRHAVQFERGTRTCLNLGINVFIEIGPHPILNSMAQRCFTTDQKDACTWIESAHAKHSTFDHWMAQLSTAFMAGAPLTSSTHQD